MPLFLLTFFTIYIGMHVYVFMKALTALRFGMIPGALVAAFMLIMVLAPIAVRYLELNGFELSARFLALLGYSWLGLIFIFVCASLAIDAGRLLIYLFSLVSKTGFPSFIPFPAVRFYVPLIISAVAAVYGVGEANRVRTERLVITSPKIPREAGRIKIAQISDVHIGLIVREGRLNEILDIVRREKPDILVSTGDLIDAQAFEVDGISTLLNDIRPPLGKYAVTGNHEFFAGIRQAIDFTKRSGFVILRGKGETVNGLINIAGVDDPAGKSLGESIDVDEEKLLSSLPRDKFTLLLKHRPVIGKRSAGLFDLQLSGHTHLGQIFPFRYIVALNYPKIAGLYKVGSGSMLYTSRGSGTWGPPFRVLAPPEVTIIELVHGNNPAGSVESTLNH